MINNKTTKQDTILLNARDIQERRKAKTINYINGRTDVNPFMIETIGVESNDSNYKYLILQLGYAGNRSQKYYSVGYCN